MVKTKENPKDSRTFTARVRNNLVRGIAVLFPVYLTFVLLQFLIRIFSKPLTPAARWITRFFDLEINPLMTETMIVTSSPIVTLVLLVIVGLIAQKVIGARIVSFFERILNRLPIIRTIYRATRELTRIMTGDSAHSYRKVVCLTLPGEIGKVLGFITGSIDPGDGIEYHTVFVPTTPNITTGFLLLMKADQFVETNLTPEEGLRFILSAGVLSNKS